MFVPSLSSLMTLLAALLPGVLWLLRQWLKYLCFLGDLGNGLLALVTELLPLPFLAGALLAWTGCILWYHRGGRR